MEFASDTHPTRAEERRHRSARKLRAELGPVIMSALDDPDVLEIIVNPPELGASGCAIWLESLRDGMRDTRARMAPVQVENIICTIATMLDSVANRDRPILEGELPFNGSRFEGFLPPVVSTPSLVIRKRALLLFTLDDYVRDGILKPTHRDVIRQAIQERRNIIVSGGAGTGKTTLINTILKEMVLLAKPEERFVIIEDTVEIQCEARNALQLRTSETMDIAALLRATLRARPDRIIIGEVRGKEALTLVKAWGTGHPGGVASLHANSSASALVRLDQLIQEANVPSQPALVADTIDLVVHLERAGRGRRIKSVVRVEGYSPTTGAYRLVPIL
jgi:type IV secretion system protein VirB11